MHGQWEGSRALGFKFGLIMRKIILPQSIPLIIPPTGNQFIAMLKDSSLVSVIGVWELMFLARTLGNKTFNHMEMLITAANALLDDDHGIGAYSVTYRT